MGWVWTTVGFADRTRKFEQFYDPYRNYNAPIFAIPGNHDGAVFKGEGTKSLAAFVANFCTSQPGHNPDSLGAVRTQLDQPGVYFTLNAPFVKFPSVPPSLVLEYNPMKRGTLRPGEPHAV